MPLADTPAPMPEAGSCIPGVHRGRAWNRYGAGWRATPAGCLMAVGSPEPAISLRRSLARHQPIRHAARQSRLGDLADGQPARHERWVRYWRDPTRYPGPPRVLRRVGLCATALPHLTCGRWGLGRGGPRAGREAALPRGCRWSSRRQRKPAGCFGSALRRTAIARRSARPADQRQLGLLRGMWV